MIGLPSNFKRQPSGYLFKPAALPFEFGPEYLSCPGHSHFYCDLFIKELLIN